MFRSSNTNNHEVTMLPMTPLSSSQRNQSDSSCESLIALSIEDMLEATEADRLTRPKELERKKLSKCISLDATNQEPRKEINNCERQLFASLDYVDFTEPFEDEDEINVCQTTTTKGETNQSSTTDVVDKSRSLPKKTWLKGLKRKLKRQLSSEKSKNREENRVYVVRESLETLPSIAAQFRTTPTKLKVTYRPRLFLGFVFISLIVSAIQSAIT